MNRLLENLVDARHNHLLDATWFRLALYGAGFGVWFVLSTCLLMAALW